MIFKHLPKNIVRVLFLALVLPCIVFSHPYRHYGGLDVYDAETGFYYKGVFEKDENAYRQPKKKWKESYITNLFILNPKTNRGSYLFGPGGNIYIAAMYFESSFNVKEQKMETFKWSSSYFGYNGIWVKNNENVKERAPLDRILIVTVENPKERKDPSFSLWSASKSGEGLRKLMIFSNRTNWHIDVKNNMIRILDQKNGKVMVNSIDL